MPGPRDFKSTPEWAQGSAGEREVRKWLQEQGYLVANTAAIEDGGAPMFHAAFRRGIVLPDLLSALNGRTRFGEVKTKSTATWYRKTRIWEHGFGKSHWLHYLECQKQTGIPVDVIIWELSTSLVLMQSVDRLAGCKPRFYDGNAMPGGEPMVFFHRDWFNRYRGPQPSFQPIAAKSERTLSQRHPPMDRQLSLLIDE